MNSGKHDCGEFNSLDVIRGERESELQKMAAMTKDETTLADNMKSKLLSEPQSLKVKPDPTMRFDYDDEGIFLSQGTMFVYLTPKHFKALLHFAEKIGWCCDGGSNE